MATQMWTHTARWITVAMIGSAMSAVGCSSATPAEPARVRRPIAPDESVAHAFDTNLEVRLVDRLELDHFLCERDIRIEVVDGVVELTGEVWTPLEKQRAGDLMRHVAGVIDVANHLDIRPPR